MINAKDVELFWNGLVHKFYQLKALITLEPVNTSVQNFDYETNSTGQFIFSDD